MYTRKSNVKLPFVFVSLFFLCATLLGLLRQSNYWQNKKYRFVTGHHLIVADEESALFWFDTIHSTNPDNIMFSDLETLFYENKPDLVLVEGGYQFYQGKKEEAFIDGASAYATALAKDNYIPVEGVDPPLQELLEYLQQYYAPSEILTFFLLNEILCIRQSPEKKQIDLNQFLETETRVLKENGLLYNAEQSNDILKTINHYTKVKVTKENWLSFDYKKESKQLSALSKSCDIYKNTFLLNMVKEKKSFYKKIFIVANTDDKKALQKEIKALYN